MSAETRTNVSDELNMRERDIKGLLARAGAEITAIGEQPFDHVFALVHDDRAAAHAAMRAEIERRSQEVGLVIDRLVYAIQCRAGARAAARVRVRFDRIRRVILDALGELARQHG